MAIEGRGDAGRGQRIRLGMVGGGEGAFIGAVHRIASRIDDHYDLVAGALSSTPDKARRSGAALGLAPDRIYDDYKSMAKAEAKRADGIEAVAIVTPNDAHAGPTYAFLKAGDPRHLRQAADGEPHGSEEDARRGREVGPRVRADPQLHRLPARPSHARDGARRRTRRDPSRSRRISSGLADRRDRGQRQQAGGMARRSEALGRGRIARRHRHPRLQSRRLRDGARPRRTRG